MKKLSIIIPVYNEERFVKQLIETVLSVDLHALGLEKEIIVINDASTDFTSEVLKTFDGNPSIRVFSHAVNQGKGAALHTGFENASGEYLVIQDADLEYDPFEYPVLLRPILEGKADVVYGSRFAGGEAHRVLYFWHSVGNKFLTLLSNMFSDLNLTDMETCYKAFRTDILRKLDLKEKRFGFEPEVTAKVAKLTKKENVRIFEVGVSYYGRTYREGKKISARDGLRAVWCILKYNIF